jgi:hypothetical protein
MADDLSNMSNEQLLRGYQGTGGQDAPSELSAMSTEDLMRRYQAQQQAKATPEDVSAGMALRGIPLVGAYIPRAEAAIRAATGQGKGESFSERYGNLVPEREAQYAQAEHNQPIASGLLQAGGGTVALAPLGAVTGVGRALGTTGGLLSRTAFGGASGAGISAADAYLRGEDPATAAMWGGGIGAAAAPIASGMGRVISPFRTSPERAAAVQALAKEGVTDLTAGQKTGGPLRWAEGALGGISGASESMLESQQKQFTRAAARRGGLASDELMPETINNALESWGKQRDTLAAATGLHNPKVITDVGGDLGALVEDYARLTQATSPTGGVPGHYLARYIDAVDQNGGVLPGKIFAQLTSDMARDVRTTGDPTVKNIVNEMRQKMFDGMEQATAGTPHEGMWRQMNQQYRNLLTLQKAAANPTEATALAGTISPSQLYRGMGGKAYARDFGDLGDLTRSGLAVMKPLPSSGTSERSYFMNLLPRTLLGAGAGGAYGGGDPQNVIFGALAGGLGPQLAGRALMSRPAQRYLANQVLTRAPQLPAYAAPVAGAFMQQ